MLLNNKRNKGAVIKRQEMKSFKWKFLNSLTVMKQRSNWLVDKSTTLVGTKYTTDIRKKLKMSFRTTTTASATNLNKPMKTSWKRRDRVSSILNSCYNMITSSPVFHKLFWGTITNRKQKKLNTQTCQLPTSSSFLMMNNWRYAG